MKTVDIIVPVFNEQENIGLLINTVQTVLESFGITIN
jgi:glycosyltransferase involved in cell wall biosynthesis